MSKILKTDTLKAEKLVDEISKAELDALNEKARKVEDLEKAVADKDEVQKELDTLKSSLGDLEVADLIKAAAELKDIKKAQAQKVLEDTIDVVKGFNLFEDDQIEDVAKFFVKSAESDATKLILASLEKARTQIEEFGSQEFGHDHEGETTDVSKGKVEALGQSVSEIIKSRKNK